MDLQSTVLLGNRRKGYSLEYNADFLKRFSLDFRENCACAFVGKSSFPLSGCAIHSAAYPLRAAVSSRGMPGR